MLHAAWAGPAGGGLRGSRTALGYIRPAHALLALDGRTCDLSLSSQSPLSRLGERRMRVGVSAPSRRYRIASRRGWVGCEDWRRRRTRLDVGGRRLHVRLSAEACSQTQALSRSKRQKSPTVRPRQLNPTKHRAPCPDMRGFRHVPGSLTPDPLAFRRRRSVQWRRQRNVR